MRTLPAMSDGRPGTATEMWICISLVQNLYIRTILRFTIDICDIMTVNEDPAQESG